MLNVPIQSAVCVACFGIALPIAIALFPQMTQVSYHLTAPHAFYNVNYTLYVYRFCYFLSCSSDLLLNNSIVLLQQ